MPEPLFYWPATSIKKRLWQRCFLVNYAKFIRTPFLQKPLQTTAADPTIQICKFCREIGTMENNFFDHILKAYEAFESTCTQLYLFLPLFFTLDPNGVRKKNPGKNPRERFMVRIRVRVRVRGGFFWVEFLTPILTQHCWYLCINTTITSHLYSWCIFRYFNLFECNHMWYVTSTRSYS